MMRVCSNTGLSRVQGTLLYKRDAQALVCRMDRLAYPIRDDVPVMLEEKRVNSRLMILFSSAESGAACFVS